MNLLIVDDEIHIIDMLKSLIDWDTLKLKLVGTAADGPTAGQMVTELKPDIVITDIRIPGYDGLELIKRCREQSLSTQFIIISGFRQFEYAQNAIRYGVKDYLLKPIKKAELNSVLSQLITVIKEQRQTDRVLKTQENMLSQSQTRLKDSFLSMLSHDPAHLKEGIEKINSEYMLDFKNTCFRVIVCKIDTDGVLEPGDDNDYFLKSLKDRVASGFNKVFGELCHSYISKDNGRRLVLFLNYDKENSKKISQELYNVSTDIFSYVNKFEDVSLTMANGCEVYDIADAADSLLSAEKTLKQRILSGANRILSPLEDNIDAPKSVFSSFEQRAMKKNIESFDMDALHQQIADLFTACELLETRDAAMYWTLCKDVADFFWNTLLSMRIIEDVNWGEKESELYAILDSCSTLRRFSKSFSDYLIAQFKNYYDTEHPPENIAIIIARKYIANHYMEKITLKDIAAQVYLNPVYFSICFKKDTGLNFVDYMNEYRIEKSKERLKTLQGSVASVAESVGFPNARYFSKIFKRYVGLTPAEYRKKYGAGNLETS